MDLKNVTIKIPANSGYNCEYRFKVPSLTYTVSSELNVFLDKLSSATVRVYQGNDRSNLTTIIESNAVGVVGAPYKVPVDDGIVIVVNAVDDKGGSI